MRGRTAAWMCALAALAGCPSTASQNGSDSFTSAGTTGGTPGTTSGVTPLTTSANPTDASASASAETTDGSPAATDSTTGPEPDPVCGDGVAEGDEDCDGRDLAGMTCIAQGFDGGELSCDADCGGFDTRECFFFFCGNGTVQGDELCDTAEVGAETCVTQGFDSGELMCNATCDGYDTSTCGVCGDGSIEGAEDCDTDALGGMDCLDLGFDGGTISCAADCSFDTTECTTCGNGTVEGDEVCDGADLGGATCNSIGFDMGNLACDATCNYDLTGCSGGQCLFVNGLTWCYNPAACGEPCIDVCAVNGLVPVADETAWLQAQDEQAECDALALAFGFPGTNMSSYTHACLEDTAGDHSGSLFVGDLLCSTFNGCPASHVNNVDNQGIACDSPQNSRRAICPCE